MTEPHSQAPLPRKIYTPEERDRAVALSKKGHSNVEIARLLGLHGHWVNSIINCARREGLLPRNPPKEASAPRTALPPPPPPPLPPQTPSFVKHVVPCKIVRKSVMNRMSEVRQTVDSIMRRLKEKEIAIADVKGEVAFLRRLSLDIEHLLEQLHWANGAK